MSPVEGLNIPSLKALRTKLLWHFFFVFVGFGVSSDPVSAGGLLNIEDSWLISSPITHQLLMGRKFGSDHRGEIYFTVAQGRLHAMNELTQRSLTLEGVLTPGSQSLAWTGKWQQTGEGIFVEDLLAVKLMLGIQPALGVSFKQTQQILGGEEQKPLQNFYFNLNAPFNWSEVNGILQLQWPIFSSGTQEGYSDFGRRTEIIKATIVHAQNAFAMVVDRVATGQPNFGFQMLMTLTSGIGLEFRVDSPTGSIGPGLAILRGGVMLRTSHVVHPHLGVTHRLALVVGRFGGAGRHE